MTAIRKTISVAALVDDLNQRNAYNGEHHPEMTDARSAMNCLAESVLMEAGAYRGFEATDGDNGHTDPTRRRYHVAGELR